VNDVWQRRRRQQFHGRECQETRRESARETKKTGKENTLKSDQTLNVIIIDHDAFLDERGLLLVLTRRLHWRERRPETVDSRVDAAPDI
jgi:hypothetical protein